MGSEGARLVEVRMKVLAAFGILSKKRPLYGAFLLTIAISSLVFCLTTMDAFVAKVPAFEELQCAVGTVESIYTSRRGAINRHATIKTNGELEKFDTRIVSRYLDGMKGKSAFYCASRGYVSGGSALSFNRKVLYFVVSGGREYPYEIVEKGLQERSRDKKLIFVISLILFGMSLVYAIKGASLEVVGRD